MCGQHVALITEESDPKQRMKSQLDTECAVRADECWPPKGNVSSQSTELFQLNYRGP